MHGDESAALADELHERFLSVFAPGLTVVVGNDHAVSFEVRFEGGHVASFAGRSGDFHCEQAGFLDDFFRCGVVARKS